MTTHETILKLPDPLLREACDLARTRKQTVGDIVRSALATELRKARKKVRKRMRTLEVEVAPVRAELARDLAEATSWYDLQARLRNKGYFLRPAGSGLSLVRLIGDARICSASALGPGYGALRERFGGPFPGGARQVPEEETGQVMSMSSPNQTSLPLDQIDEGVVDF
ncbi:MAG: hypothetical protein JJ894_01235 [Dinoroseobacter sp.]|nr:hypothetical protein [Dinoroseobacter sp.]